MRVLPLAKRLAAYLAERGLRERFEKQRWLFEQNPFHPSLHTEILEPRHLRIYSFRITRRYRAIFIYRGNSIEIVDVNDHYQ